MQLARLVRLGITVVAGAALVNQIWYERKRRRDEHMAKQEIGKWEAEGGNVPEVPTPGPENRRDYA